MSTEYTIRQSDDDLDVPDFMRLDADRVSLAKPRLAIVGEVVEHAPTEPAEDDTMPGVVEYYTPKPPVLYRTGSAALTAARVTGRVVGAGARHGFTGSKWFGHGAKHTTILAARYVRGHDHKDALGGVASGADWNKIHATRHSRWKFLGKTALGLVAADVLSWWGITAWGGLPSADSWGIMPLAEAVAALAAVTIYGRYRLNNKMAAGQLLAPEDIDDGEEPYPLAYCKKPEQVEDCVGRALAYEGISTRRIQLLGARPWGYEVDIDLKGSTPGKVNAVADQLDTHFDIKVGGTLIEPDLQRSAHITLRLVTDDPFKNMPSVQVHAPNSLDISEPVNLFCGMDGSRPGIVLEGTRVLAIGVSGAAKSTGVLRDLAEVVTACHNAIALDLDPVKDGLREFEGVMAVPPIRGNKACEEWLDYLVKMAEARNVVRNRLDMGDTWVATKEHPAIFPFADEFIYLSPKAKENFIKLLRLGKQTGIYPVAAGQDATSDSLGDAIADSFTLRIMLAARHADIPLVFGQGAIAAGWRPDRLQPAQTATIRNDAGRSYIKGAGLDRPILYGWNELTRQQIKKAVADRAAAGRPWFDHDTLAEAGLLHLAKRDADAATSGQLVAAVVAVMTAAGVDRMRTEVLLEGLAAHDPDTFGELTVADLRKALTEAGAGAPVPLGAIDGMANPRGYKLDTLTALG